MPDTTAIVTALITDRPMCMDCLVTKSGSPSRVVESTLAAIRHVLAVHRDPQARCRACGKTGLVIYLDRPQ
jgi:hypothetical protein